jgi:hypothetical protein
MFFLNNIESFKLHITLDLVRGSNKTQTQSGTTWSVCIRWKAMLPDKTTFKLLDQRHCFRTKQERMSPIPNMLSRLIHLWMSAYHTASGRDIHMFYEYLCAQCMNFTLHSVYGQTVARRINKYNHRWISFSLSLPSIILLHSLMLQSNKYYYISEIKMCCTSVTSLIKKHFIWFVNM